MDDELKLEDLAHLMDVLHDVQIKWYSIGLQLGLAVVADLEIIKNQTTQSEQGCLCEMLIKWLRSGRATISALCKALRNRTVGEDVLAGEIERSQQPADQSSTSKQQIGSKTSGGKNPHPPPPNSPPPPKRTKSLEEPKTKKPTKQSSHATQAAQKSTPKKKKLLSVPESLGEEDFSRAQPPDRLCVKCHRVPLNPQRSVCCNRLYCKPCADKTKKCNNKKHKEELQYTPDKKLHTNIQKLKIKCKNRTKGCDWEGEVFNLKNHLPECPRGPSTSTNSCQQPVRLNSEPSLSTLSTSTSSTTTALPRRISHTCDQREPRLLLPSNSSTTTQPSAVPNPPPRQTSASATFGHAAHTSQSAQSHSASLNIQFEATSTNTVTNATPPVHLAMTNVNELQRASTTWVSQSFLSHQLGYRLCLAVHVGTDNQLRIGVTLAQGQQNSFLKFPCSGKIIVKVMHPLHSNTAVEVEVPFTLSEGGVLFMPVLTSQCVAFNDLVARNCLFFQVSRIYLDSKCQPWLLGPNYTSTNNNP